MNSFSEIIYRSHKLNIIFFSAYHLFASHFEVFFVSYRDMFIYIIIIIISIFNKAKL